MEAKIFISIKCVADQLVWPPSQLQEDIPSSGHERVRDAFPSLRGVNHVQGCKPTLLAIKAVFRAVHKMLLSWVVALDHQGLFVSPTLSQKRPCPTSSHWLFSFSVLTLHKTTSHIHPLSVLRASTINDLLTYHLLICYVTWLMSKMLLQWAQHNSTQLLSMKDNNNL